MQFFLSIDPPTTTAQMKQVRVVHGKPVFYDPPKVVAARALLTSHLVNYKPDKPLKGPIALTCVWCFPRGTKHRNGEWRMTKPDTDNLQKLLKDCMTRCGYWVDDAQVVIEHTSKVWVDEALRGLSITLDTIGRFVEVAVEQL